MDVIDTELKEILWREVTRAVFITCEGQNFEDYLVLRMSHSFWAHPS